MIEQLFGSKTRVHLLRLFLANQGEAYFVRELTRKIGAQINAVRNELDNLVKMGIVEVVVDNGTVEAPDDKGRSAQQRKYYRVNTESVLYPELRALFAKAGILLEKDFVQKLEKAGTLNYLALLGHFVGEAEAPTDVFIVGNLSRTKLASAVKNFEKGIGKEINYTVLTAVEFRTRKDLTDRFLYSILDSNKVVVVDKMTQPVKTA
jgi:DNA-binding transcriptional ArsR family regulator